MNNLQLRIISAIVLAAFVLVVTWIGGMAFRLLSAAIMLAILYEWTRMARSGRTATAEGALIRALPDLLGVVFAVALVAGFSALVLLSLGAVSFILLAVIAAVSRVRPWDAAGYAYAALSGLSLAMLRDGDQAGLLAILFLFAVVWSTDVFAYFVGRAIGGPKLAPSISPGKTRSGAVGGMIFGVVAGLLVALYADTPHAMKLAGVAALLSIVSQAGDLFESWVKRRHGVKDSGWIIPGHGGVMDRVDGLVAAAWCLFLVGALLSSADRPAAALFPG